MTQKKLFTQTNSGWEVVASLCPVLVLRLSLQLIPCYSCSSSSGQHAWAAKQWKLPNAETVFSVREQLKISWTAPWLCLINQSVDVSVDV